MAIFKKTAVKSDAKKAKPAKKAEKVMDTEVKADAKNENGMNVKKVAKTSRSGGIDLAMVIIRPHITEKASDLSEKNVYGFEINKLANKMHVRAAVEKLFKVTPMKIAIINGPVKTMKNPRTGRVQTKKQSIKKAFVYLKKGDKIEFV